ncbi:hypothetical protein D3C73_1431480 [compost metagenome]
MDLQLLVHAAVDGVQESLSQVGAGAEELHLLADAHCGYTAGNSIVIAEFIAHQVVAFVLDRAGLDGHLGTLSLEGFRQLRGPQNSQVRLR